MNTLVLFTNIGQLKPDAWVSRTGGVKTDSGQFVVETKRSWISICVCDEVFGDYDEEQIRSLIKNPEAYLVEWRGEHLLGKFVKEFPSSGVGVIDNDH